MGGSYKNDVFVFDTKSEQVEMIADGGSIKFASSNNACVAVSRDKIVALV